MKKKILLKTLVVTTPLLGVASPLASCATTFDSAPLKVGVPSSTTNTDVPLLVKVSDAGSMRIKATKLLIPGQDDPLHDASTTLICENQDYVVGNFSYIHMVCDRGTVALLRDTHYKVSYDDEGNCVIKILSGLFEFLRTDNMTPNYLDIKPHDDEIKKKVRRIVTDSDLTYSEKKETLLSQTIETNICILDGVKNVQFKEVLDKTNVLAYLGDKQIDPDTLSFERIDETKLKVSIRPLSYLSSDVDIDSDLKIIAPTESIDDEHFRATVYQFEEIKDFHKLATFPRLIDEYDTNFRVELPLSQFHNKRIIKAIWHNIYTDPEDEHDCNVEYEGDKVIITSKDDVRKFEDHIRITIKEVKPWSEEIGTFKNDSWQDIQYWSQFAARYGRDMSDEERKAYYCNIYDLDSIDELLGTEKIVNYQGVPHKVVLASMFQLPLVKEEHETRSYLSEDEIIKDRHAAFTFQFTNELTNKNHNIVKWTYNTEPGFFLSDDSDYSCWEFSEWIFEKEHPHGCRLRCFLRDDFEKDLDDLPGDMVEYTASHRSVREPYYHHFSYIPDKYWVPTASQLNSLDHTYPHETDPNRFFTEPGVEPFDIYKNETKTDGEASFRKFLPAEGCTSDPISYWVSTPSTKGGGTGNKEDTIYVSTEGAFGNCNYDNKNAIIPCFSIL